MECGRGNAESLPGRLLLDSGQAILPTADSPIWFITRSADVRVSIGHHSRLEPPLNCLRVRGAESLTFVTHSSSCAHFPLRRAEILDLEGKTGSRIFVELRDPKSSKAALFLGAGGGSRSHVNKRKGPTYSRSFRLVAGAGFEPATFGL